MSEREQIDQKIYTQLQEYSDLGVIEYVLPTDPIGDEWVIGMQGQIVKLHTQDEALAFLAGASAVACCLADQAGISLEPNQEGTLI